MTREYPLTKFIPFVAVNKKHKTGLIAPGSGLTQAALHLRFLFNIRQVFQRIFAIGTEVKILKQNNGG